jgi:hypothetical protein
MYEAVKQDMMEQGMSEREAKSHAAAIAQSHTGKSLATGRKPKGK